MLSRIVMAIELAAFVLPSLFPYTVFFIFMGLPSLIALPLSPLIMLHEGFHVYALMMMVSSFSISVLYVLMLVLMAKLFVSYMIGNKNTLKWWRRNIRICVIANGTLLIFVAFFILSNEFNWFRDNVVIHHGSGVTRFLELFYFSGLSFMIPVVHLLGLSYRPEFIIRYISEVSHENG
ncbi:hypothetical protein [Halomonas binhaiensis]|uniref:Uncharacterized protein n=1 Tax=Halomonas binhaiensis TaxID=2562282 RepID=A0A5C1NJ42_9GAMM|nr:hypothetical protein [Halomonas binhaiensis]QEM82125.1 hypothetical protein E4T21_11625 [Halomonas binhaiensis]